MFNFWKKGSHFNWNSKVKTISKFSSLSINFGQNKFNQHEKNERRGKKESVKMNGSFKTRIDKKFLHICGFIFISFLLFF